MNDLTLTNAQLERLDTIYGTVYQALLVLLEKTETELPWDMELIGDVTDSIAYICEEKGHHLRYPGIVTADDGSQSYAE